MKTDMVLKQFRLNTLILFCSELYWNKEVTAVLLTASKNFNVGMHSDVSKSIWFNLGVIIDTIELYVRAL